MREAVHCIGALLILTGSLGTGWMCWQLAQSVEQVFHHSTKSAATVVVAKTTGKAKAMTMHSPFVLMPEVSSTYDY